MKCSYIVLANCTVIKIVLTIYSKKKTLDLYNNDKHFVTKKHSKIVNLTLLNTRHVIIGWNLME